MAELRVMLDFDLSMGQTKLNNKMHDKSDVNPIKIDCMSFDRRSCSIKLTGDVH